MIEMGPINVSVYLMGSSSIEGSGKILHGLLFLVLPCFLSSCSCGFSMGSTTASFSETPWAASRKFLRSSGSFLMSSSIPESSFSTSFSEIATGASMLASPITLEGTTLPSSGLPLCLPYELFISPGGVESLQMCLSLPLDPIYSLHQPFLCSPDFKLLISS